MRLLMVAGEASGDLHAARLLAELRRMAPQVEAFGLGGDEMTAAGFEALAASSEISVVGLSEVLKVLPRARQIFALLLAEVERRRPDAAVLVDSPGFNLRLARALKARGIKVIYYISPQVWAWRRGRVKTIARLVDKMLVLFAFEAEFYRAHGVDAVHVGHPLVDEVPELAQVWDSDRREPFSLALLPGSRGSEVEAILPGMLETVRRLAEKLPVTADLIQAPTIPRRVLEEAVALSGVPVRIVAERRFEHLAGAHLALCASGTATLEVGLLGTPLLVLYRLHRWTYLMGKMLVRLPYISLVNLVLGRALVPELLQSGARPERVARLSAELLGDRAAIDRMRAGLAELRPRLGARGASRRAAAEVLAALGAAIEAPTGAQTGAATEVPA